jgi:hypothetical protein
MDVFSSLRASTVRPTVWITPISDLVFDLFNFSNFLGATSVASDSS